MRNAEGGIRRETRISRMNAKAEGREISASLPRLLQRDFRRRRVPRPVQQTTNQHNKPMSNLVLECKDGGEFKPHPEGIHPAVCVDVIDLGMVETEFQGERRVVPKVKVVFESEEKTDDGRNCTVAKNFTASLHPKAKLADFLGKWRGRPVTVGESIDLTKLVGASCTLVISHQQNMVGKSYASIDAVSKPTKKLALSGGYDPVAARKRVAEWKAKQMPNADGRMTNAERGVRNAESAPAAHTSPRPSPQSGEGARPAAWPVAPVAPPAAPAPDDDVPF